MAPPLLSFQPWPVDPVLAHALAAALAVVLLLGAWAKWRDLDGFRHSVAAYQLLPAALLPAFGLLLPLWELGCGLAVLLAPSAALTGPATAVLLLTVTGAIGVNLLRGHRDIGCGCSGLTSQATEPRLSWPLVVRNALLLLAMAGATGATRDRPLFWIDNLSVAGTTLALLGLYAAAHQLLTHHPRLMTIKRS